MLYKLNNIYKTYRTSKIEVKAINGIDLGLEEGKFYSFIGASGSGKSTLLHLLGLLDTPSKGTILIDGIDTSKLSDNEKSVLRNEKIGFVFQKFYLIPVLNVYENIELPLLQTKLIDKNQIIKRIDYLIENVGLTKYKKHKSQELSGGQQQRVAIARALVAKPKVVLADEPTANLDSKTGQEIIQLMRELNREEKTTFIFSTHDSLIMDYSDEIKKIKDGVLTY